MPRQQQYYQDPARYFTEREARKDQGLRDILNMMMMKKQQEKEQARLDWEQKFKERELSSVEKGRETTREYYQHQMNKDDLSPMEREAQRMVEAKLYPNTGAALRAMRGIQSPEEKLAAYEEQKKIDARYPTPQKPTDYGTEFRKRKFDITASYKSGLVEVKKRYATARNQLRKELAGSKIESERSRIRDMIRELDIEERSELKSVKEEEESLVDELYGMYEQYGVKRPPKPVVKEEPKKEGGLIGAAKWVARQLASDYEEYKNQR